MTASSMMLRENPAENMGKIKTQNTVKPPLYESGGLVFLTQYRSFH
jgi:hypothetical protein